MRAHTITNLTRPAWRRRGLDRPRRLRTRGPGDRGRGAAATSADAVRDWNLYAANALGNPSTAPACPASARRRTSPCFTWRWCRAPSTTPSTRSTAGTSRISRVRRPSTVGLEGGRRRDRRLPRARRARMRGPGRPPAVRDRSTPLRTRSRRFPTDLPSRRGRGGEAAAAAMLAARADDGRFGPFTVVEGTEPGEWRQTPPDFGGDPGAWVGNVRPFLVPNVEMLRSDGPNALTSAAYAEDFNEVKELGSLTSTTRTADQTAAAIFWQDSGISIWNRVFRALAASEELDSVDSARLLAMTNLAGADGSIGCWNDKYYWNFWRPITAIREAAATATRRPRPTRPGCRSSTRPFPSPDRRSSPPASPTTRRGTPASAARSCTRCRPSSAPTRSRSRDQQQVRSRALPAEELRPLLGGAQGDHRRARVERHPLPHRRRAGRGAGQEGRPLARQALLPAGEVTLK